MSCRLSFPKLMVFGCVFCEGDVMPPHFFRRGLRLKSDSYVELLITVVRHWMTRVANGRPYEWQQDSAPCHTSWKSKIWLLANYYVYATPNVWPINSPDLNPMDYYIWGAVEKDINHNASTTKAKLIDRIKTVFETLPWEGVTSVCSWAGLRLLSMLMAVTLSETG